ncbi:MAG: ATP-binding protein, partial [Flavobacteriales bacterium]|nr:ATP-binding protein [Flavobacteriales bacterium]
STNFFPGKDINIVPREGEDVVYVLIGEDEQPIYELGDGIQTIIILTYPLFFNMGKEMLVFIEEPEHFLHPGMQRLLIETFLKPEFSNFQYFITTHSNHFLELMNESNKITLFKVSQGNTAQSSNVTLELKPSMNLLDSLGVNNASVLLSNCSIWVEGITDRLYLKKYLEVYWKETPPEVILKEDFHFSFVEYSGGNLTHWNFDESNGDNINAKKITNRIFLISDSDFDKNGKITKSKQKRFENLSNALGDNFYLLPVKEIENTLSKVIVEKVICKKEDITLQNLTVKKGVRNNFDKENLGDWICKKYDGLNRKYVNGNTLHDKVKFAQLATEMITDISDLSTNAVELCEKITAFILSHNEKID